MTDILEKKSSINFECKKCDYITCRKSQYDRHLLTPKHQNTDKILTNTDIEGSKSSLSFTCNCGKNYKHRQSLFNHKKKCTNSQEFNSTSNDKLVEYLMKENSEFKNLILEALKNGSITPTKKKNKTKHYYDFYYSK